VIDADGRVLRPGGDVVPGLWACGGAAATLFGSGQPGCGSALGGALVEAYRAVLSLSGQLERIDGATA
jgi:3-oxosteroid 1-dehydrogenase